MFDSVSEKLKAAEYFLHKLKSLEKQAGHLAHADGQIRRYQLDGFLFEIIAAKDLFLQEINFIFKGPFKRSEVTLDKLLSVAVDVKEKNVLLEIKRSLSDNANWLNRLNAYRNVTAHRALMGQHIKVSLGTAIFRINTRPLEAIKSILKIPKENINSVSIHLAKNPDDPSQGACEKEIIPYCEDSLRRMRNFLSQLYKDIN